MTAICPICQISAIHLRSFVFPEKEHLPANTDILVCGTCSFAFSTPRKADEYLAYYRATMNDSLGADVELSIGESNRYAAQASILGPLLDTNRTLRVLDVGCGQAGLLRMLCSQHPQHRFFGVDPNVSLVPSSNSGIHFSTDWRYLEGSFDLIILSHVIEHLVDFDDIALLTKRLAVSGHIYLEVPDTSRYGNYLRREFLYYFDRLHINHFTRQSLQLLASQWGLHVHGSGCTEFEYKDGKAFPAIYLLASAFDDPPPHDYPPIATDLQRILRNYIGEELVRAKVIRQNLEHRASIVVYGFGDNFFKSTATGGPLEDIPIAAIVDMRHASLSLSPYAKTYRFMDIEACCTEFPDSTYVIAVSWGNLEICNALQDRGIRDIQLI